MIRIALAAVAVLLLARPAAAQVAGSLGVQNAYVFRGYDISARRPVAVLSLSYDHPSGFYASGSGVGVLDRSDDPETLAVSGAVGYARRVSPSLSLDGGVNVTRYFDNPGISDAEGYTEVYVGASGRRLSSRLYFSPNYYAAGVRTLYGEVEGSIPSRAGVRLSAHLGYLVYLATPPASSGEENEYDWRIGAARTFGRFDLHAAVTGGGPGRDHYGGGEAHGKTAVVVGASVAF